MKTLLGTIDGYLARVSTKTYVGIVFGTVLAVGLSAMAIPPEQGKLQPLPAQVVAALTRPCILQPGAWTNIACTGTGVAATSALLNQWSQYLFYCPQNSAIRTGTTTTQAKITNVAASRFQFLRSLTNPRKVNRNCEPFSTCDRSVLVAGFLLRNAM